MTQLGFELTKRKARARGRPCVKCGTDQWWIYPRTGRQAGTIRQKCVECHRMWTRKKFGHRRFGQTDACMSCGTAYVVTRHNRRYCSYQCCVDARKALKHPKAVPGPCEVCGQDTRRVWDHNHHTGAFRGWLCNGCNSALGFAGDDPQRLRALALYLDARQAVPKQA